MYFTDSILKRNSTSPLWKQNIFVQTDTRRIILKKKDWLALLDIDITGHKEKIYRSPFHNKDEQN